MLSIIHENRDENCAFWNQLVPKLIHSFNVDCHEQSRIQEDTKFLPINKSPKEEVEKPHLTTTTMKPKIRKDQTSYTERQANIIDSLRKKSELFADINTEEAAYKTATTTEESAFQTHKLNSQFIPNQSTQVSFRMGVKNVDDIFRNEAWNDSDQPEDDNPVTTTTARPTTQKRPTRRPTWRAGTYDPFSVKSYDAKAKGGYSKNDGHNQPSVTADKTNILHEFVETNPPTKSRRREENANYFPSFDPKY